MTHDNPFSTSDPVSPPLALLLVDAARRLGLNDDEAALAGRRGALMIDRVPVAALVVPDKGQARYDTLAVATLHDVTLTSVTQAQLVLNTNTLLLPISGFSFGVSYDGDIQLTCGMRLAELDGESLARTLLQLCKCAASMRETLLEISGSKATRANGGEA